jgi:hypothetical protein
MNDKGRMTQYQLAQLNIARMLGARDSESMAEFFARIDEINTLADNAPGFVWRLQTESGNATEIRAFDDEWLIVNMSVWDSVDALKAFTYNSAHAEVMRKRRQWFHAHTEAYLVMWWIPAGHIPAVEEAKDKLDYLQTHGESEHAFTFKKLYLPQDA